MIVLFKLLFRKFEELIQLAVAIVKLKGFLEALDGSFGAPRVGNSLVFCQALSVPRLIFIMKNARIY